MPWDSEPAKQQLNSHESEKIALPNEVIPNVTNEPKSLHVADTFLQPFLSSTFDPADYLNSNLPSINRSKTSYSNKNSVSLSELFPLAQDLVSQVSANTTRLTTILTQLTDDIHRSGSRLAYEVEILRENTLNLSEALTDVLHDDLARFIPDGLDKDLKKGLKVLETTNAIPITEPITSKSPDPAFLQRIRTLTVVRSRLEEVIKTFGNAMAWSFPPSEISTASSFLSVSGPDIGSGLDGSSTEEKGQQVSKKIRNEISELLNSDDPITGIETAAKKVEELKDLVIVWKGTIEERARLKFIESLARMVEDRHRDLLRDTEQDSRHRQASRMVQSNEKVEENKPSTGYGFISQLQKLRGS